MNNGVIGICKSGTQIRYFRTFQKIKISPFTSYQIDNTLRKENTMSSTLYCNHAANDSIFKFDYILESISANMLANIIL
jgi:hypothetical protein